MRLKNNFFIELHKGVLDSKKLKFSATKLATDKFILAKNKVIIDFESHPVSQEIAQGPDGPKSQFLNGVSDGNLFSFIGFEAGLNPIQNVLEFLNASITIAKTPELNYKRNIYKFRVRYPIVTDFQTTSAAPMPRGTSKNWLYAIERGIPGINSYLYKRGKSIPGSSSGPAIQAKGTKGQVRTVRSGAKFQNTSYFSEIINKFTITLGKK